MAIKVNLEIMKALCAEGKFRSKVGLSWKSVEGGGRKQALEWPFPGVPLLSVTPNLLLQSSGVSQAWSSQSSS